MLIAAGLAVQVGFAVLNPRGLIQVPYAILDPGITSYYTEAIKVTDLPYFLRHYVDLMPTFSLHAKTHPPGPILFFWGFNQFFQNAPWATDFLATVLSKTPLSLEGIAGRTGLAANQAAGLIFSSFLLPALGCATLVPLYLLARNLWDHQVAFLGAALWIMVPSLILFTPEMDQLYALLSATSVLSVLLAVRRRQNRFAFLGSLIASVGLFFSFAFLAVIFLNLLFLALSAFSEIKEPDFRFYSKATGIFLITVGGSFVALFLLSGFNIQKASVGVLVPEAARGLARPYFPWVVYNLYDFFIIGLGFPFFAIFSYYLLRSWDSLIKDRANLLAVAYLMTLLCLNLSGVVLAEVARIWLFMLPFPVLYAARSVHALLEKHRTNEVFYILALQYGLILVYKLRLTMIILPAILQ
jgi:hypothetical protein